LQQVHLESLLPVLLLGDPLKDRLPPNPKVKAGIGIGKIMTVEIVNEPDYLHLLPVIPTAVMETETGTETVPGLIREQNLPDVRYS